MFTKSEKGILLLSIYEGSVSGFYRYGKTTISKTFDLKYLKVEKPKLNIKQQSFSQIIERIIKSLNKKAGKVGINFEYERIYVLTHGNLSAVLNTDMYVKLTNAKIMDHKTLETLVKENLLDAESFSRYSNENFIKTGKVINRIAPNYYNSKAWRSNKSDKFKITVNDILVDRDIVGTINSSISELNMNYPIYFINPAVIFTAYHKNTESKNYASLYIDIGRETVSVYQIYKGRILAYTHVQNSYNDMVRMVEKEHNLTFELASSALLRYLKGKSNQAESKESEKVMNLFKTKLQEEIKSSPLKKDFYFYDVYYSLDKSLDETTSLFLLSSVLEVYDKYNSAKNVSSISRNFVSNANIFLSKIDEFIFVDR